MHLKTLSLDAPFIAENGAAIVFREDDERFDFFQILERATLASRGESSPGTELSHLLAFKYAYCPEAIDIVSGDTEALTHYRTERGIA